MMLLGAPACRKSPEKPLPLPPPPETPNATTLDLGTIQSISVDFASDAISRAPYGPGIQHTERKFTMESKGDRWEAFGAPIDSAVVKALAGAFDQLVPSDGLKNCDSRSDDYPDFTIHVTGSRGAVDLLSTSNCRDCAPWNVVHNGKLYVQSSGKLGKALDPLLRAGKVPAATWFGKEGGLMFDYLSRRDPPKGVTTVAEPFQALLLRRASASPVVADAFPGRRVLGVSALCHREPPETDNPACARLDALLTVALDDPFAVDVGATVDNFEVQRFAPVPTDMAAKLASSKLYRALAASSTTRPLVLSFTEEKDCNQARHAAEDLGWRTPPDCSFWYTAGAAEEGAPPSLFYIPTLQVAWILHGGGAAERAFYEALGASERFAGDSKPHGRTYARTYVRLDGTFVEPKGP
jgi:hypothetical protein